MNQLKTYAIAVGVLVSLAGAGLGFYSWLQAHDARLRMEIIIQQKDAAIAQRDKEAAQYSQTIEELKKQAQTPQQVVKFIPQIIKVPANDPAPVVIDKPNQLTPADVSKLPDAPSTLLPNPTLKILVDQAADYKVCANDLKTCKANLSDERDKTQAAVAASRGGGFWKRLKANKDAVIVGGVIGAVLTVAIKH